MCCSTSFGSLCFRNFQTGTLKASEPELGITYDIKLAQSNAARCTVRSFHLPSRLQIVNGDLGKAHPAHIYAQKTEIWGYLPRLWLS